MTTGKIQHMVIDPASTYVLLNEAGSATQLPGGETFWSKPDKELDQIGQGWLVSEFVFDKDWPNWEMHPHADEVVYLLEGEVRLLLDQPSGIEAYEIRGRGAIVVPRGIWHTAEASVPCRMLHITMGQGTQSKPVSQ